VSFFLFRHKRHRSLTFFLVIITLSFSTLVSASPQVLERILVRLSTEERSALENDEIFVTGERGKYEGRFLVKSSSNIAWQVLTDYDNFEKFIPNTIKSTLIEAKGDRKIFEQINQIEFFLLKKKFGLTLAVTESYPQKLTFKLVGGHLKSMNGTWQIESIKSSKSLAGTPADLVMISHQVAVTPKGKMPEGVFYTVYKDNLKSGLKALKEEIIEREKKQ
jgi:ribosome-associated toxin RatA of RatAB toxin-antitoxin module